MKRPVDATFKFSQVGLRRLKSCLSRIPQERRRAFVEELERAVATDILTARRGIEDDAAGVREELDRAARKLREARDAVRALSEAAIFQVCAAHVRRNIPTELGRPLDHFTMARTTIRLAQEIPIGKAGAFLDELLADVEAAKPGRGRPRESWREGLLTEIARIMARYGSATPSKTPAAPPTWPRWPTAPCDPQICSGTSATWRPTRAGADTPLEAE